MQELVITNQEQNQRLDKFLMKYMNEAPKSFIYKMLRKKRIKLNGRKAEGNEVLQEGDKLQMYLAEETLFAFMAAKTVYPAKRHFGIVYEDENILVVSKPAGLLTHPEKPDERDTLIDQILYELYQKKQYDPSAAGTFTPAVCNRLDRNTSGIIVAGKNLMAVQAVNEAIQMRRMEKYYLALVIGEIREPGEINNYLVKDKSKNQSLVSDTNEGVQAVSQYRPIVSKNGYTLLEIRIITGRSHQIRAHMQAIGHPILGDRKYGREENNRFAREKYGLSHQFLHAYRLSFAISGGPLDYLSNKEMRAPLPTNLKAVCNDLFGIISVNELSEEEGK